MYRGALKEESLKTMRSSGGGGGGRGGGRSSVLLQQTVWIFAFTEVLLLIIWGANLNRTVPRVVAESSSTHPCVDIYQDFATRVFLKTNLIVMPFTYVMAAKFLPKYCNLFQYCQAGLGVLLIAMSVIEFQMFQEASVRLSDQVVVGVVFAGPAFWQQNLSVTWTKLILLFSALATLAHALVRISKRLSRKNIHKKSNQFSHLVNMIACVGLHMALDYIFLSIKSDMMLSPDVEILMTMPQKLHDKSTSTTYLPPKLRLSQDDSLDKLLRESTPLAAVSRKRGLENLCLGKYKYDSVLHQKLTSDSNKKLWLDTSAHFSPSLESGIPDTIKGSSIRYPKLKRKDDIFIIVFDSTREHRGNTEMPMRDAFHREYQDRIFVPKRTYSHIGTPAGWFQLMYSLNDYDRRHYHTLDTRHGVKRSSYMLQTLKENGYELHLLTGDEWGNWDRHKWQISKHIWDEVSCTNDEQSLKRVVDILGKPSEKPQFVLMWIHETHGPGFPSRIARGPDGVLPGESTNKHLNVLKHYDRKVFGDGGLLQNPLIKERIDSNKLSFVFTADHGKIFPGEESKEEGIGYGPVCVTRNSCIRVPVTMLFSQPIGNQEPLDSYMPFILHQDLLPTMVHSMGTDYWPDMAKVGEGVALSSKEPVKEYELRTSSIYGAGMGIATTEPGGFSKGLPILVLLTPEAKIIIYVQSLLPPASNKNNRIGFWIASVHDLDTETSLINNNDTIPFSAIEQVANTAFHIWLRKFRKHNEFQNHTLAAPLGY